MDIKFYFRIFKGVDDLSERDINSIALLDSGVGGLTVASELIKLMPEKHYIYYGDTVHLPYGVREIEEVKDFAHKIINFLMKDKNADIVVLACNTASSAIFPEVKNDFDIPIFGTINSTTRKAYSLTENNKVAIIATEATINSGSYQQSLYKFNSNLDIYTKACPKFVDFVEKGELSGKKVYNYAKKCLLPLKNADIDTLILGCTHFPYLKDVIKDIIGEKVSLVDPAVEMAYAIKDRVYKNEDESNVKLNNMGSEELKEIINKENNKVDFMVSDINNISDLLWNNNLLSDISISASEVNIFI